MREEPHGSFPIDMGISHQKLVLGLIPFVRSSGPSTVSSSATKALKAALRSYVYLGRDRQRIRGFFSAMLRGVSNAREG
jgi:transposase